MMQRRHGTTGTRFPRVLRVAAAAAAALALAGCAVPNWANPVRAYDSVFGRGSSSSSTQTAARSGGGTPNLSSVPARPQTPSAAERRQSGQGLVADRNNARYTDDIVRSDDEGGVPLPPRNAAPPASSQVAARATPAAPPSAPARSALPPIARDDSPAMPATPRDTVAATPAAPLPPPPPAPTMTAQAPASAADPLADRRVTPAQAATTGSVDPLADRRVTPGVRAPTAATDSLDARRTITTGRAGPAPQPIPPVLPPSTARAPMAPPPVAAVPAAPPPVTPPPAAPPMQSVAVAPARLPSSVTPAPLPAPVAPPPALRDERDASFALRGSAPARTPAPGQDNFASTFNSMIAQSAATVTTAPANVAFMPSGARPILPNQTMAPPLAQQTYNDSLGTMPAALPAAGMPVASGGMALPGFGGRMGPEPAAVVRFANGSSSVPAEYRTALRRVADEYRMRGGAGTIRVVGHASGRAGGANQNLVNFKVSLDRAQSVAGELIRLGVNPQAIYTEAVADNDPLFDENNPRGEAENRRAEIYLDS